MLGIIPSFFNVCFIIQESREEITKFEGSEYRSSGRVPELGSQSEIVSPSQAVRPEGSGPGPSKEADL